MKADQDQCVRCGRVGHLSDECKWPAKAGAEPPFSDPNGGRAPAKCVGVRTLADLLARCVLDEITGCMVVDAPKRKGSVVLWLPVLGRPVTLAKALAVLLGKDLKPGQRWVPRCGETACANPEHRFIGTRSDLMRILRPTLDPLHRMRIAAGHWKRETCKYSPELRAEILSSEENGRTIAARLGVHNSVISDIRRGKAWRQAAPASSVFALGGRS
jgi:hypothetical protein